MNALKWHGLAVAGAIAAAGCSAGGKDGKGDRSELTVYAAASTRDALLAIELEYEKDHNVDLIFNLGSSGDLSRQILASPKADVFLSADEIEMDRLDSAKLLVTGTRRRLFSNQLVIVEPA